MMTIPTRTTPVAAYNPNRLLDTLLQRLGLRSDGALSRRLNIGRSVLSAIRHGRLPVGASLLLWIQEGTGIAIEELRTLLGDRRGRMRPCTVLAGR